ncbi:MAG: low molecular weight protein-tyrosine-phosphatase [Cyclonatronaceae bacterium]
MTSPVTVSRTITRQHPFKITFVCLGNICRSPTAEGIFQHLVNERGLQACFQVDSSGTSAYHIGEPANSRSRDVAAQHGVKLLSRASRFERRDLDDYDLIVAMDRENRANIRALDTQGLFTAKIRLLREFDPHPEDGEVPDPYYGGMDGFQNVFRIVKRSCEALLDLLEPLIDKSDHDSATRQPSDNIAARKQG